MRTSALLCAAWMILCGFALLGCETSHSESTKTDWFGNTTHKETTVTENPITGDTSVHSSQQTVHQ